MMTIKKENSDFLININMDITYYGKERFGIKGEAEPILSNDKLISYLGNGDIEIFSSIVNDETQLQVAGSDPNMILGATAAQIGIQSMISEPETGIADLSFSTNASADGYLIGKEITGEIGFLETNDNATLHDNLGLFPGIENYSCSIDVCGDLLIDEPNDDLISLDSQGVIMSESVYETGSLVSINEGALIDPSFGYANGRIEFLATDASFGDIRLTNDASILGTSRNTLLDVGIDSNYELGTINQVGVSNIQAENNFNLIDADLEIGIDTYKNSGLFNDGIARKANDFDIVGDSVLDGSNVFTANGLINSGKLNLSTDNQLDECAGIALTNEASLLGTSEDSLLGLEIDYDPDVEVSRHEDILVKQVVNEALEEFGKSFKFDESEICIKSFTKTFQSNSSCWSSNTINMAVVNFINVEGDIKHNKICLVENNDS